MTLQAQKILDELQVRKTPRQKEAFYTWLCDVLRQAGYEPRVEQGRNSCRNIVAGDPEQAGLLLTAHYDTQAVLPFPNFITPHNPVLYVLYQLLILLPVLLAAAAVEGVLRAFAPQAVLWWLMPLAWGAVWVFAIWWMLDGPANKHTANDNTSGVVTLLETALTLPAGDREKVCFVFFDNEEKGMLGAAAFAREHKKAGQEALCLNFDCVSDGDSIQFFPSKALRREEEALGGLEAAFRPREGKQVQVVRTLGFYPSDNVRFRRSCGVCALKKGRWVGWYMDRIHTGKDTVFMEENIELLRQGCLRLAAGM